MSLKSKQQILIAHSFLAAKDCCDEINFITLPHPKDSIPLSFIHDSSNKCVLELQSSQSNKYCSWFINQRISSAPGFFIASRIDVRYLLLPFIRLSTKFQPLDQILTYIDKCDRFPLDIVNASNIAEICDLNDKLGDDMILYRHNEDKVLSWLKKNVDAAASVIATQRLRNSSSSNVMYAKNFDISAQSGAIRDEVGSQAQVEKADTIKAIQLVCDYLEESTSLQLIAHLGFTADILNPKYASIKRKADWENELELEKETLAFVHQKPTSSTTNSSILGQSAQVLKKTSKPVPKPATGAKSITSFFTKK